MASLGTSLDDSGVASDAACEVEKTSLNEDRTMDPPTEPKQDSTKHTMSDHNGNIELEEVEVSFVEKITSDNVHSSIPDQENPKSTTSRSAKKNSRPRRVGKLLRSLTDMQLSVSSVDNTSRLPATPEQPRRTKSTVKHPKKLNKTRKTKSAVELLDLSKLELHLTDNNSIATKKRTTTSASIADQSSTAHDDTQQAPAGRCHPLDISGQTGQSRYPWQRDVAVQVQCDEFMISQTVESRRSSNMSAGDDDSHTESVYTIKTTQPRSRQGSEAREWTTSNNITDNPAFIHESGDPLDEILNPDLSKYRRGGRRTCIISDLDLGPERQEKDNSKSGGASPQAGNRSIDRVSPRSLSRGGSSVSIGSGNGSRPNLTSPTEVEIITNGYSDTITPAEKSKSLTKSFIKLLPSRKKAFSPESLEHFLKNELKPSMFYDDKLLAYRHSHWRELIVSKDGDKLTDILSNTDMKRLDAVWELFINEIVFLSEQLMVLKHVFMEPLKKCQVEDHLMLVEPHKLFGNLDELCHISYAFCRDFMSTLTTMTPGEFGNTDSLVECLDKMTLNSRHGDIYHSYLLNYKLALTYLDSLRNEIEEVGVFTKICEQDPRCNRLKLTDLLVAPMHHWTRLPLVLTRIRAHTTIQRERERLDESINSVVSSLKSLDDKLEWMKTYERVREIERQLIWPSISELDSKVFIPESLKNELANCTPPDEVLANQGREVLYEGQLVITEREKATDAYAFLFNDYLLLSKLKKDGKKYRSNRGSNPEKQTEHVYHVMRQPLPVHTLSVYDISSVEASSSNMKHAFVVAQRNAFQQVISVLTLQAHTSAGKESWMAHINEAREQYLNSDENDNPTRHESFKQLMSLDEKLLKNSRVLEITSGSLPRLVKHNRLRKLNSSAEIIHHRSPSCERMHVRQRSATGSFDSVGEESSPIVVSQSRSRAMSTGSVRRDSSTSGVEGRTSLTIQERTPANPNPDDSLDDVVFNF